MKVENTELFTAVCLPKDKGGFPALLFRSPYVDDVGKLAEEQIVARIVEEKKSFIANGYAVIFQHCRGRGKSRGDCVPFLN